MEERRNGRWRDLGLRIDREQERGVGGGGFGGKRSSGELWGWITVDMDSDKDYRRQT